MKALFLISYEDAYRVLKNNCDYAESFSFEGFTVAFEMFLERESLYEREAIFSPTEFCTDYSEYEEDYLIDYLNLKHEVDELIAAGEYEVYAKREVLGRYLDSNSVVYRTLDQFGKTDVYIVNGL